MANRTELPVAFAADESVVINFGILSGREATQAELDRLAHVLRHAGADGLAWLSLQSAARIIVDTSRASSIRCT